MIGKPVQAINGVKEERKMTNAEKIIVYLRENRHEYCDDCISNVCGIHTRQQVNQICNDNINQGIQKRTSTCFSCGSTKITRSLGDIIESENRNLPGEKIKKEGEYEGLSEDEIKKSIHSFLEKNGWEATIAWSRTPGIDIDARKDNARWIIEVKGHGSRSAMRVNYFLAVLGELLQRMDDKTAKYSIALPDLEQFKRLWAKLPQLAKERTNISCLFVAANGRIQESRMELPS
jgi:hypothetical protein